MSDISVFSLPLYRFNEKFLSLYDSATSVEHFRDIAEDEIMSQWPHTW